MTGSWMSRERRTIVVAVLAMLSALASVFVSLSSVLSLMDRGTATPTQSQTPQPSATTTATITERPRQTLTPEVTPTPSPSPTKPVAGTLTPTPSSPAADLIAPADGSVFGPIDRIEFSWTWEGELQPSDVFALRVWPRGRLPETLISTRESVYTALSSQIAEIADPGIYLWNVAVVRLLPDRSGWILVSQESEVRELLVLPSRPTATPKAPPLTPTLTKIPAARTPLPFPSAPIGCPPNCKWTQTPSSSP